MPAPDSTLSTLANIRTKVRRLTRSPSTAQITDADIDNYINTFVIYDFPENLRLFNLRTTLTFFTDPYIDTYSTNTTDPNNPLYNFNNRYISVHDPVLIAGNKAGLYQSRESFYNSYPMINQISQIGTGDGVTTHFTGTLTAKPVLRGSVLFSAISNNNTGLEAHDDGNGVIEGDVALPGTIDYVTGVYDFTYVLAVQNQVKVYSQTYPYTPSIPRTVLFFNGEFIVRPIPDQPYRIECEVFVRPTEFLSTSPTQTPELSEWWQYIAYGAAIKIFQDRMDQESVNLLMPEFKQQELLVLRRSIVQQGNERVATIFTESEFFGPNNPFGGGGGLL